MSRPNPRLKTIAEEAACPSTRRHFCARYEACLTVAAINDWPTFSCDRCRVDEVAVPIDQVAQPETHWDRMAACA